MTYIKRELQHANSYDFSDSLTMRENFISLLEGRTFIERPSQLLWGNTWWSWSSMVSSISHARAKNTSKYIKNFLFLTSQKNTTMERSVYFYIRQTQPNIHCILVLCDTTTCFGSSPQPSSGRKLVHKESERGRGLCKERLQTEASPPFYSFYELMSYLMMAEVNCRNM
jgi:hypothetical protein